MESNHKTDSAGFLRALLLLWYLRMCFWFFPQGKIFSLLNAKWRILHSENARPPEQIATTIVAASRFVPFATCLMQSIACKLLLQAQGYSSTFCVGVTLTEHEDARDLEAHAWVECDGKVILGDLELTRFVPIMTVRSDPQSKK